MGNRIFGNRYQVTEKIGMGGMAEVYKATDSTLGRTVAVKVMLPQYAADPSFAARFRQEAQAAANLNSPYIVNIYDWGKDQDSYYIVMEYVRGTDLKTAIQQRGHIHPRKVAEIGSQVCSALSVAHGYDIIHRDIKSANIMVQADGNVKVMDFGIAQAGVPGMTQDSTVLGTAHYVSPEQAQGKKLAATSDLYSLGVVLYEAATGKLPFDGPDVVSVAMKQVNEAPVPPRQINPEIDPQFEQIILRAMEKDPAKRFQTANEMKRAIDDYLKGNSISSAPTQVIGQMQSRPSSYAADHTSVMPAPVDEATHTVAGGTRGIGHEPQPKKKNKKPLIAVVLVVAILAIALIVAFATGAFNKSITVPSVLDQTLEEATDTLEGAGLKVGNVSYDTSEDVEKNRVMSQNPQEGSPVPEGTPINIVISSGPTEQELVEVPNLIGLTASQAEQSLAEVGLKGNSKTASSDQYDEGQVFDQDPDVGSQVPKGATVSYTISTGEKTENAIVTDVIGLDESDARSTLESQGFVVKVREGTSDKVDAGQVYDQSPDGGTESPQGATVTIYVSTGSATATVPNVVGQSEDQAKSKLEDAGFKVKVNGKGSIVVDQSPSSGSADTGSTVTITMGDPEPAESDDTADGSTGTDDGSTTADENA